MRFEDILMVFAVLSVAIGALVGHLLFGSIMTGFSVGLVLGLFPLFLLGIVYRLMMRWCPDRPLCICGKCSYEDYEFLGPFERSPGDAYYYRCPKCEREYRHQGKRFELRLSDDDFEPYMVISRYGRWKKSG